MLATAPRLLTPFTRLILVIRPPPPRPAPQKHWFSLMARLSTSLSHCWRSTASSCTASPPPEACRPRIPNRVRLIQYFWFRKYWILVGISWFKGVYWKFICSCYTLFRTTHRPVFCSLWIFTFVGRFVSSVRIRRSCTLTSSQPVYMRQAVSFRSFIWLAVHLFSVLEWCSNCLNLTIVLQIWFAWLKYL